MLKASADEVKEAIDFALMLRERGKDQHHVVKVLLDYHEQLGHLLKVFHATERFLHAGLAEHEHSVLLKTLEQVHRSEAHRAHADHTELGLD